MNHELTQKLADELAYYLDLDPRLALNVAVYLREEGLIVNEDLLECYYLEQE